MVVRKFGEWSILAKILSISMVSILLMFLAVFCCFLPAAERKIVDEKKEGLKEIVETCVNLVAGYDARVKAGEFPLEEGQKRALERTRTMLYGKEGYVWINDMQPRMIMHPTQPALDGKDLSGYKDPNGKFLFVEFVNLCKEKGDGFVGYMWPKPGATEPVAKISYVKAYGPWGWILGTGAYLDGVAVEVSALRRKIVAGSALLGLIIAALAVLAARRITRPLTRISEAVERIAAGDLSVRLDGENSRDEAGILARNVDRMVLSFNGIIGGILESANGVFSAVDVMRSGIERTASGAADQSMRAAAVATSAEEMSQTITDIARNAQAASTTSSEAMQIAEEGRKVAGGAVHSVNTVNEATVELAAMVGRLNGKVGEIGNIVTVIEEIADQTNLLALNAAIEAARAGDQGRGFAVVADEVKKLAERTIAATTEISRKVKAVQNESHQTNKSMEDASEKVGEATGCIRQVGESLARIVEGVQKARDEITRMAAAVEEQSATSEEIARNVEGTAVTAREIGQTAAEVMREVHGLAGVAAQLNTSVGGFGTGGDGLLTLDLAKNDHRAFVHRIGACLKGYAAIKASDLPDHHNCRFGKWYDARGSRFAGLQSFRDIAPSHDRLHALAKEIVAAHDSGNATEAECLYRELEGTSRRVVDLLDRVREEAGGKAGPGITAPTV